ncbi:MAG TPA: hypothetical protein VM344_09690 [Vitreimonas sp.]|nr:hypothetical protein [Vitreimonas sp.]
MRTPLDLGGFEILLAVALLLIGTVVFCVATALIARAVDWTWDALES